MSTIIYALCALLYSCSQVSSDAFDMINESINQHSAPKQISSVSNGYFGNVVIADYNRNLPDIFHHEVAIDQECSNLNQVAYTINKLSNITVNISANNEINIRLKQSSGTLSDLLDQIAARLDMIWQYKNRKIILSDQQTKIWSIKGIPGDIDVHNQISSNSGIHGQSGSASTGGHSQAGLDQTITQNIKFSLTNNAWDNIEKSIRTMISKNGSFNIIMASSSIVVTDKPSVISRIDEFIKAQNDIFRRQVQIDVQVLSVETSSNDNYGINWNLVMQNIGSKIIINGQNATNQSSSMLPIFVPTATTQAFTVSATNGNINGSQLVLNALSSLTKTALVTSTAATTLNNQPVPVEIIEQQGYVASVATTQVSQAGSQTAITPGQIVHGFVLNILPVIEDNNTVTLQIALNLSSLKSLTNYTSQNGSSVQLPDIVQRNTIQKATIHSGDTYVLTGFDSEAVTVNQTGVTNPTNWIFGGGKSTNSKRTRLVVLVTPRVIKI